MARKKQMTFEDALKRLEELVHILEDGDSSLEQSIELYKEGMDLSTYCSSQLADAEKRIVSLQQDENGSLTKKPFLMQEEYK
jgi:exodeoxyribonuclease VII small subunit